MYTQNNEFILNALLEYIKFIIVTHWECFIREYPSVLWTPKCNNK